MLTSFWTTFLKEQEKEIQKNPILLSLLKQLKPLEFTDSHLTLGCENNGACIYLEKRREIIESALIKHLKKRVGVAFKVIEKKNKKPVPPLLQFQPSFEDVLIKSRLNRQFTFNNFAVSSTNQVAFAAAQAVAQTPGVAYNPLFFYGGVGVGKTHLAQAIGRKILENNPEKRVYFCPGDQFTNELIESIREKATPSFRKKYRQLNLFIIDDIQFIAGKQTVQEEFFHTFNSIISSGGQIILTSDRPPTEIKNLEDRLRSRFSGGLIVDIQPPDFELRTAILLIKAREKNIPLEMEAAQIIAEHNTDTRALEGSLLSLYAKIIGKKDKIDLEVVEEYYQKSTKNELSNVKKITSTEVVRNVCSFYNIKPSQLKSNTRQSRIALARQVAMYIMRTELQLRLEEIAFILKKKDHTTIIHGVEKIKRAVIKNEQIKNDIVTITSSLK